MFMGVCFFTYGQKLVLIAGSSFTNERVVFRNNSLKTHPIGFFTTGLGYVRNDGIMFSLSYSFDIRTLNMMSYVPIVSLDRKRKSKRK